MSKWSKIKESSNDKVLISSFFFTGDKLKLTQMKGGQHRLTLFLNSYVINNINLMSL